MGDASISARRTNTLPLSFAPFSVPSTPVSPTRVCGMPNLSSSSSIRCAVRNSLQAQFRVLMKFPTDGYDVVLRFRCGFLYIHDGFSSCLSVFRFDLITQTFQTVECIEQRLVLLGKMQANQVVDRLTEEARARNRAYADIMRQILAERKIALVAELGNVEQNIVRALRVGMGDFKIVQTFQEQILFVRVLGLQIVVVVLTELQTGNNSLLQGCCRADRQKSCTFFARSIISGGAMM